MTEKVGISLLVARVEIGRHSIACGFGSELNMRIQDEDLQKWFDETIEALEPILVEQTERLNKIMIEKSGSEVKSVEINPRVRAKDLCRRNRG